MAATARSDPGHALRVLSLEVCRWVRPADGAKLVLRADGRLMAWLPRAEKWRAVRADCTLPQAAEIAAEGRYTRRYGGLLGRQAGSPGGVSPGWRRAGGRELVGVSGAVGPVLAVVPLAPAGSTRTPAEHEAAIEAHARRVAAERPADDDGCICFGCGRRPEVGLAALRRADWRLRPVAGMPYKITEVVCPDCFERWGWW